MSSTTKEEQIDLTDITRNNITVNPLSLVSLRQGEKLVDNCNRGYN